MSTASKMTIPVVGLDGKSVAQLNANPAVFGVEPNEAVVHFVCEGQRFHFYKRTACTKTRSAVSGGGKKARPQKGTGGARQGGSRAPHWVGGGIAFGPAPILRNFKVNKKLRKNALVSILSDRFSGGQVRVLKSQMSKPSTQSVSKLLSQLSIEEARVGFVLTSQDEALVKSARNIPNVDVLKEENWTCLDFIKPDSLIFSEAAFEKVMARLGAES